MKKGLMLLGLVAAICWSGPVVWAQVATTTVQDTVYRADGTAASGSVVITWGAFTTASGVSIAAGNVTATISAGGALSVALAPNAGSVPMGSYYTAVFHLSDGTTTRQYWSVPVTVAGGGPVKLAAVSTTVLPASVAMQTVSKAYVDNAIAAAQAGTPFDASPYVLKAGDTMTGPLNLPADPVSPTQAADMHYVDENVAAVSAGLAGKVALNPAATQVVSQPVGTDLQVNNLEGYLYATPYLQSPGNNGIAEALTSANCTNGCQVVAEPTYAGTESVPVSAMPRLSQVIDARGGSEAHTSVDPLPPYNSGQSAGVLVANTSTRTPVQLGTALGGNATLSSYALQLSNNALTGGSNSYPENLGSGIPYFKSTYGVESMVGTYNTQGQHVQAGNQVNCYGIGDCLAGGQYILEDGGFRDSADEGAHPFDLQVAEGNTAFAGSCASGCTTGSTQVSVGATVGAGTQGDGRFLIDKNAAKVISTGSLVAGGVVGGFEVAAFTGTSFPVSTFVETAAPAVAQSNNIAPGTVTLPIATSGVPSGFATNTAALPSAGVACLEETIGGIPNFEMANYSVVDGTHIQLTLNRPHGTATAVGVGGLCGYGLEQTVDTVGAVRQVYPVLGSVSGTRLYYAGGVTDVVGVNDTTSAYLSESAGISGAVRSGNVVTVTTTGNLPDDWNGLSITVSGVTDGSYNGTFVVTTVAGNQFSYAQTGANSTSSGGTAGITTGGFALYPMAEVLSVYDAASKTVDGAMTLGANTVAWATGDVVEEPHYYLERVAADVEFVTQYQARPQVRQSAGKTYEGRVATNLYGWEIANGEAESDYLGSGGTLTPPTTAYSVVGAWQNDFEVQAGQNALLRAHCGARGCGRWDSGYALFSLDSISGVDALNFAPASDTVTWELAGTGYVFSPSAFSAGTINVGTLNATTITGGVAAAAITSGTIAAARLPVFGPSGPTHAVGAVPDPGATAGATRFLREDGTWNVPAGGSGGTGSLTGGALGSVPYQSAASTTAFVASPTTSGHVFAYGWQPSGSAVAPGAYDLTANLPFLNAANTFNGLGQTFNNTSTGGGPYAAGFFCSNMTSGNSCNLILGTAFTANKSASMSFVTAATPFLEFTTYGYANPIVFAGSAAGVASSLAVNNGGGAGTGTLCAAGIALCVNSGSSATIDTSGKLVAALVTTPQMIASGGVPTMAAGAAAGSGPSCTSVAGANMAGVISCTTGTGTTSSATLATVTFNGGMSAAPMGCTLMARNAAAAGVVAAVYTTAPTTAGWTVAVGNATLAASTAYSWSYSCM